MDESNRDFGWVADQRIDDGGGLPRGWAKAADAYGASLVAIVLTGANNDGAKGLRAVIDAGGEAIIQDPAAAFASAMPMAAMAECPDARILSLSEIALYLRDLGRI